VFRRGFGRMGGETPDKMRRRMQWLALAFSLFLMVLFVRLWHLQVLQGEKFRALSENNRIAYRVVRSPRGLIYDSSGRLLADNRASFNLYLVKENSTDLDEAVRHLARMTDQPYDELREKVRRANPFRPFLIKADVDRNTVAFFEEHRPDFPGVYTQIAPLRNYRTERRGGHVLGYLGEVDGQQLQELTEFNYRQGDLLGKYGVERSFENYLRGETGFKQVEVDAYGRELRVVRPFVEKPGSNLHLTINDGLQAKAEELFRDFEGGIVALDPNDGAILAMVSNPPIDPNQFANLSAGHLKRLDDDRWSDSGSSSCVIGSQCGRRLQGLPQYSNSLVPIKKGVKLVTSCLINRPNIMRGRRGIGIIPDIFITSIGIGRRGVHFFSAMINE